MIGRHKTIGLMLLIAWGLRFPVPTAKAEIGSCSASVVQSSVPPGQVVGFDFTIQNLGPDTAVWIRVTRPSGNFVVNGLSGSGWSDATNAEGTTLTGGSLAAGDSYGFQLSAQTSIDNHASENWLVEISDDGGGASPRVCNGSLGTAISGHLPNDFDNGVADVRVTSVTATSAVVSWESSSATSSIVYFGTSSDYGSWSAYDNSLVSGHSITLGGLTAATAYHFQVGGQDEYGNVVYSADNTFLTSSLPPAPPSQGSPPPVPPSLSVHVPIKAVPTEKVPPEVQLTTPLKGAFKEIPVIKGRASDNEALARVDYSLDGGRSWILIRNVAGLGGRKVEFEFQPERLDDGNYALVLRATDTSGNQAATVPATLIIDRLPPIVGGNVTTIGGQSLVPDEGGKMVVLAGLDQMITVSAVGGPVGITLVSKGSGQARSNSFNLTKSNDTGLWSGVMSFSRPGTYRLIALAIDGAGNKTERQLNIVEVLEPGRVVDADTGEGVEAEATLYYLEPESNRWVKWDARVYGQSNPQVVKKSGLRLLVPAGKYYLKAKAKGYRTAVSDVIKVSRPSPVSAVVALEPAMAFSLGSWTVRMPTWGWSRFEVESSDKRPASAGGHTLVGKSAPNFKLPSVAGGEVSLVQLRGKMTILSFVSTWSPAAREQLGILNELQDNDDLNVVPIAAQENVAKVKAYMQLAGYDLDMLADRDGITLETYALNSLPTHYLVDRRGVIKRVMVGVLSKEVLLDNLVGQK